MYTDLLLFFVETLLFFVKLIDVVVFPKTFNSNGKIEQEIMSKGASLNISLKNKGVQIIKVTSKNAAKTFKVNNY